MHDYGFIIKVSDLLHDIGATDFIEFINKYTKKVSGLASGGLRGSLSLQSINDDTILVTLHTVSATIQERCEGCDKFFETELRSHPNEITKFLSKENHPNPSEMIHDTDFFLNIKDETIDVEDFIVQSLLLQKDYLNLCDSCSLISGYGPDNDITNLLSKNDKGITIKYMNK